MHQFRFSVSDRFEALSKALMLLALLPLLVMLTGLSPSLAGEARLSYIAKSSDSLEWRLFNVDTGDIDLLATLESMPQRFFFARSGQEAYFTSDTGLYRLPLTSGPSEVEQVAPLPVADNPPEVIWLEGPNNKLRALMMTAVVADRLKEGPDGELYTETASGEIVSGFADPPWGIPYLCEVMEYDKDEGWQRIALLATRWEAEDTPGLSCAEDFRNEVGQSDEAFASRALCHSESCAPTLPGHLEEAARALYGADPYVEEIRYIPPARDRGGVIFALSFGDSWHAFAPLYFLENESADPLPLALELDRQIMLSRREHFLLVAEEYSGTNPHIIDLKSGKIVFRADGLRAIWLDD